MHRCDHTGLLFLQGLPHACVPKLLIFRCMSGRSAPAVQVYVPVVLYGPEVVLPLEATGAQGAFRSCGQGALTAQEAISPPE